MDEGFLSEEILTKGGMPYFPVWKIAKLLGVHLEDIDEIFGEHPEIVELCVGLEDFKTGEYETYVNPIGCALIAMNCETSKVGQELKKSIATVIDLISPGNFEKAKQYIASPKAHPFVKALFEWGSEIIDNGIWEGLTEQ